MTSSQIITPCSAPDKKTFPAEVGSMPAQLWAEIAGTLRAKTDI
jgi:hypothetical protein